MSNPQEFFENIVKPSYQGRLLDPLIEWKAKAAVSNADTMAERVFVYWNTREQAQVAGAKSAYQYRVHLRERVCPDFGLVWDLHDGHKHMIVSRGNRQVTSATQTGVAQIEGEYGEGLLGGGDQIVIELDDRSKRALSGVMQNVMAMWNKLLADMGL
jgi:hypothetical protein